MTSYYNRTKPLPASGFERITLDQRLAKKPWSQMAAWERKQVDTDPTNVNRAAREGRDI